MHKMIVHDAKEFAGCFYENDRSETFRASWPDQDEYIRVKWPHFVSGVRAAYAELLNHPGVPQEDKDRMYEALTSDFDQAVSMNAASPIQIVKDSQVFRGDRFDHRKIAEAIGVGPRSFRERLRTTSALFPC